MNESMQPKLNIFRTYEVKVDRITFYSPKFDPVDSRVDCSSRLFWRFCIACLQPCGVCRWCGGVVSVSVNGSVLNACIDVACAVCPCVVQRRCSFRDSVACAGLTWFPLGTAVRNWRLQEDIWGSARSFSCTGASTGAGNSVWVLS